MRKVPLGDVVEFLSGGTPNTSTPSFWDGTIPWASAKDLKSLYLWDTVDHISDAGAAAGTRYADPGTTLLLTRGMTLLNDVPIVIAKCSTTFNQDIKALVAKPPLDPAFLPYLLLARKGELLSMVDLAGHGTGRLNTDELRRFEIDLPSPYEQRRIAEILGSLDDKIELNRRMNETLDAISEALFEDVARRRNTRCRTLIKRLTSSIQYGLTQSAQTEPVGPKFLRITDIQGGAVTWARVPFCRIGEADFAKYAVADGDIFVARTGASTGENYYAVNPPASVVFQLLLALSSARRARPTFSMILSASAVQMNGLAFWLCASM